MNRYQTLLQSTDVALRVFDHPAQEPHEDPDREISSGWGLAFVRRGHFAITVDGRRRDLRAGSLFLTHPGLAFRSTHPAGCADDVCLSINFADAAVQGLEDAWTATPWIARTLPTPQLAYVHRRIERAITRDDAFTVERWTLAALDALVAESLVAPARGRYASSKADLDAVIATCVAIDASPAERQSIALRAAAVQRSGIWLTHAFRRYVGISPHQYVLRRRLARAAELLALGHSVSDACYASGFENLSHFVRSFQRAFAVRASSWRALPASEMRRKVQDLLRRRT